MHLRCFNSTPLLRGLLPHPACVRALCNTGAQETPPCTHALQTKRTLCRAARSPPACQPRKGGRASVCLSGEAAHLCSSCVDWLPQSAPAVDPQSLRRRSIDQGRRAPSATTGPTQCTRPGPAPPPAPPCALAHCAAAHEPRAASMSKRLALGMELFGENVLITQQARL